MYIFLYLSIVAMPVDIQPIKGIPAINALQKNSIHVCKKDGQILWFLIKFTGIAVPSSFCVNGNGSYLLSLNQYPGAFIS